MRRFDPADYPHGCRCACCRTEFQDGDAMVDRDVAEDWFTPTCEQCAETDAPLAPAHPFNPGKTPTACADGVVRGWLRPGVVTKLPEDGEVDDSDCPVCGGGNCPQDACLNEEEAT